MLSVTHKSQCLKPIRELVDTRLAGQMEPLNLPRVVVDADAEGVQASSSQLWFLGIWRLTVLKMNDGHGGYWPAIGIASDAEAHMTWLILQLTCSPSLLFVPLLQTCSTLICFIYVLYLPSIDHHICSKRGDYVGVCPKHVTANHWTAEFRPLNFISTKSLSTIRRPSSLQYRLMNPSMAEPPSAWCVVFRK